jgi:hypothetical protein
LNLSRIRRRSGDASRDSALDAAVEGYHRRETKIRVIEDVKYLSPKLQGEPLGKVSRLEQ